MKTTSNITEVVTDRLHCSRPVSVLQLATILACVALPATVLFPIIARPVPANPAQTVSVTQIVYNNSAKQQLAKLWLDSKTAYQMRSKGRAAMHEIERITQSR